MGTVTEVMSLAGVMASSSKGPANSFLFRPLTALQPFGIGDPVLALCWYLITLFRLWFLTPVHAWHCESSKGRRVSRFVIGT